MWDGRGGGGRGRAREVGGALGAGAGGGGESASGGLRRSQLLFKMHECTFSRRMDAAGYGLAMFRVAKTRVPT